MENNLLRKNNRRKKTAEAVLGKEGKEDYFLFDSEIIQAPIIIAAPVGMPAMAPKKAHATAPIISAINISYIMQKAIRQIIMMSHGEPVLSSPR
jgi:hypothetical protein